MVNDSMDTLPVLHFSLILLLFGLCLGSLWFYGYAIYAAIDYWTHADPEVNVEFHPRLTILKPLCSMNAQTDAALRSFCQQDYPHYQIVFAVEDATDPGVEMVRKLIKQFPDREIDLVVNPRAIGLNRRVNLLANAASVAKYGLWVIADSDITVGPNYLQQIVQPFRYPGIGVVTCPYRSQPQGWLARLQALGTVAEFHSGVLVARRMQGVQFALSSTIAIRKDVLFGSGSFEAIANAVADDYQLGHLAAKAGFRVMLSHYVVDRELTSSSFWSTLQHQNSWIRSLWNSQSWGYWSKIMTYGILASGLLLWLLQGSGLGWMIFAAIWIARMSMGCLTGIVCLKDEIMRRNWALLPLYDLLSFSLWIIDLTRRLLTGRRQAFQLPPHEHGQQPDQQIHSYELSCLEEPALEEI